jgi:UrcA family protein
MNRRSKIATYLASITLLAATLTGSKVFAAPPMNPRMTRTAHLMLDDLDLSQPADQQIARERIHRMASQLCHTVRDPSRLSEHQAFIDCVARTTEGAEPKLEQLASAQTRAITLVAQR